MKQIYLATIAPQDDFTSCKPEGLVESKLSELLGITIEGIFILFYFYFFFFFFLLFFFLFFQQYEKKS